MRWNPTLLGIALGIFLVASLATWYSLERGSLAFAIVGGVGNIAAAVLFALCIWLPRRKPDWDRIQAEQRLWESGPLGRRWLRMRSRIYDRWKD
jgi:protein-S-isoprenylcysteine O-methyltransferase Ste14